ncbi:MAG: CoA transferase, partial [Nitrospinota bacterium]
MGNGRRPLDGIRVLELASIVAAPFCGALLAEFGAEVIKVEMPGRGDDLRRMGPAEGECAYWWAVENRGKKVMTLDLHHEKAQEIVRRLVPLCDVVIENFRPGTLERWNLGWEDLSRINPRLVMARVTTFGQTGPRRKEPGFAAIGAAFGGVWYLNGYPDRPPVQPRPVYPDYLTGLFTAFGVLAALRHRDATGEGQWIDAALYESAFRVLEFTTTWYGRQGVVRERGGRQHAAWPGGSCQTKDGRWVAFTAPTQPTFERLCAMLGHPDLPRDERFADLNTRGEHMPELLQMIEDWFASRTYAEAAQALESYQVPYSPIMNIADIFADPHYRERNMIIEV